METKPLINRTIFRIYQLVPIQFNSFPHNLFANLKKLHAFIGIYVYFIWLILSLRFEYGGQVNHSVFWLASILRKPWALFFPIRLISIPDLFAVPYLCDVCNEDKCCVVTNRAADILLASLGLFTWLVYVRTYCVPITTLNQNKRFRLLYLGDAQIITVTVR